MSILHHLFSNPQSFRCPSPECSGALEPSQELLQRWRRAYAAAAHDAEALGIPASAIPQLPLEATPAQISSARQHLTNMVASFLSAGL